MVLASLSFEVVLRQVYMSVDFLSSCEAELAHTHLVDRLRKSGFLKTT